MAQRANTYRSLCRQQPNVTATSEVGKMNHRMRFASEEARAEEGQKDQEHRRHQAMDYAQTRGGNCEEVSDLLQVKCLSWLE
jgi:hypothetical protein